MNRLVFIVLFLLPINLFAITAPLKIDLEKVHVNTQDRASVLRGAKFFAGNCMVCHTMKYLEHNKIAKEAGITLDKMPLKNKEWWLGIVPPDLTLIARQRTADWLYTYFHSFYKDSGRPTGSNNLLTPNVNMTNVFAPLQGQQELLKDRFAYFAKNGVTKPRYYSVLKLVQAGSMTPEEFNATMTDLVNFLVYAGDPAKVEHQHIGYWVLGFLFIFLILAFMLKRAYWKDVK